MEGMTPGEEGVKISPFHVDQRQMVSLHCLLPKWDAYFPAETGGLGLQTLLAERSELTFLLC